MAKQACPAGAAARRSWSPKGLITVLAVAAGCGPAPAVSPASPGGAATGTLRIAMPGPGRERRAVAVAENRECERCHQDVAAEWRASLHRGAHDDEVYQRAFALEPLAFCTSCHAPEALAEGPVAAAEGEMGVGCVTCHVTSPGTVLAAPSAPVPGEAPPGALLAASAAAPAQASSSPGSAPHTVVRDERFGRAEACAGCHEFEFPDRALRRSRELMQSTVTEHSLSPAAGQPCAECHMPRAGARRSHAFDASRSEALVRSAARVSAERPSPRILRVTLAPGALGHAFPTGDLFRRIEILGEVLGPETSLLHDEVRYLARHLESVRRGPVLHRVLTRDDRLAPGSAPAAPLAVEIDLGAAAEGRPIAFRVAYQRVQNTRSVDDRDAPLDGEILLAEGILTP